jgi:exodeoxyribonuclease V alpha subunit
MQDAGKPLLVSRNDYQAQLFNGDIGVVLPDPNDTGQGQLWAWFIGTNGQARRVSLGRLPEHELAYAMTVHKAQGSQFEDVLFVLPDRDSPVLTRELIYTAATRASGRVEIWFSDEILMAAIQRKARCHSGLREALQAEGINAVQKALREYML